MIEGELALRRGRLPEAIEALRDGQQRHDSWFTHFLLGRARMEAGQFVEALAEFQLCVDRQGEATDLFIDDKSTIRYFAPAYYWLGRAQEEVGAVSAAQESYQAFLALRTDADPADPLATDALGRAGSQP